MSKLVTFAVLYVVMVAACGLIDKPNNAAAFASGQIVALAEKVEQAQAIGALSETEGDKYLTALLRANELLIDTRALVTDVQGCEATDSKLQCIDKVLAQVEAAL